MRVIDYSRLLNTAAVRAFVPSEATPDEQLYRVDEGIQFRSDETHSVCCENVRLADGAFLLVSQNSSSEALHYQQIVNESDWVHIQFRLIGGGCENVDRTGVMHTPGRSCIVSRYPENCVVERTADTTNGWKTACLFATPLALARLLDIPVPKLAQYLPWRTREPSAPPHSTVLPLQSSMILAVNDILSCSFRGSNRLAYMRAKSLELLSTVTHTLDRLGSTTALTPKLSAADMEKVALAHSLILAHLEDRWTLSNLARKVGVNRTKLALGFKAIYGVSVQAFWRNVKLDRARQMLQDGETSVTETAFSIGYSELSSFTRAFNRRFGIAPRECLGARDACPLPPLSND